MLDSFIRHPFMSRTGEPACSARAFVEAMCRVEIALARVQEDAGLLASGAAARIEGQLDVDAFDMDALAADSADGGNVAIPFVKQAKAQLEPALRGDFHRGATSQDIVDTALMLVLKPRLNRCLTLLADCRRDGLAVMDRHVDTVMIGRTLMQQAMPITFGAKVAQWLWGLAQAEQRLAQTTANGLFVQFGGPVGAHTGLADNGLDLMDALAVELGLTSPMLPWHTDRQPVLALGDALGAVAVAAEKIALDLADKVADLAIVTPRVGDGGPASGAQEAVQALVALGYSFGEADKAVRDVLETGVPETTEELIRQALAG